jgi:protein ImuB
MTRIGCLHLPNWSIQRLHVERPELRRAPLVLYQDDGRRGKQVIAYCELAAHSNIYAGQTLTEATASTRRNMAVLAYEPTKDVAALARLAVKCERFSPCVGWDTLSSRVASEESRQPPWYGSSADHLFLDFSGLAHLFGGEEALAGDILSACQAMGYDVRIAITATPGASWALAKSSHFTTIASTDELPTMLGPLPVARLRLPAEAQDALARLGVETIDQLRQLPRVGLTERFAPSPLLRLDQAFGVAAETIVPHRPPPCYEAACDIEYPTDRLDVLEWLIAGLLDSITVTMRTRCVGAMRLVGRMVSGIDKQVALEVGLYRPTDSAKQLAELLQLQIARLTLPGYVRRIELRVDRTAPLTYRVGQLFESDNGGAPEWAALLERLSSRIGAHAVLRPVLMADVAPERAYRYVPLIGSPQARASRKTPASVSRRPLRLFNPPQRIDAVSVIPDGPPIAFHWCRVRYVIARHWGPEQIETGWWRGRKVWRDYYRVETDKGRRFWLFRSLHTGDWYVHGSFE